MINFSNLKNRIKKNEGYRSRLYYDKLGFPTIGFGHLIKDNQKHLMKNRFPKKYLLGIFELDFKKALKDYLRFYSKKNHSKKTAEVYIEMIFQLGIVGQRKFIKMNNYIEKNEVFMAVLEMKNSLWYSQTPKRVDCLINILLRSCYEKKR